MVTSQCHLARVVPRCCGHVRITSFFDFWRWGGVCCCLKAKPLEPKGLPHGEFAALGMFLHRQKKTDPAQHLQLQLLGYG